MWYDMVEQCNWMQLANMAKWKKFVGDQRIRVNNMQTLKKIYKCYFIKLKVIWHGRMM
jgi:hypothetical protein